jgi:phospholipase D1/2
VKPPAAAEPTTHPPGSLRRAAIRFALLLLLLGGSFAAVRWTPLGQYLEAERLQALLAHLRGAWWSPLVHLGLFVLFGSLGVPATPFVLAGAAIFGFAWGTLWNWLGVVAASLAGYLIAKALGREFVERLGGDKVKRAEAVLHRRGFLPLVAVRFLPLPFSLVNASAAVVGVRLPKFVFATALGVAPPIVILTYFASALLAAASGDRAAIARQLVVVSLSMAFLVFLPIGIRRRLRRRRLRRLRSTRAARSSLR